MHLIPEWILRTIAVLIIIAAIVLAGWRMSSAPHRENPFVPATAPNVEATPYQGNP